MSHESPTSMMRPPRREAPQPLSSPRRRGPILAAAALVALALGWVWLWYYSASVTDSTLAGWARREAAAGRTYSCASRAIGGFPFRIEARCTDAAAEINNDEVHLDVKAKDLVFAAQLYRPTVLVGTITAPLTLAQSGQAPSLVANWLDAKLSVGGLPADPKDASLVLERPRVDRAANGREGEVIFVADHADLQGRMIEGSANNRPVIETVLHLAAAQAPALHPLLAQPIEAEFDAVLRGFRDLSPKPWAERFREMQAAGGSIEIRVLRLVRPDAIVVGNGRLSVNAHGKLDGTISVAVAGIETIVPLLGIDQMIGRGLSRLSGSDSASTEGLGALDRLVPGLGGAIRETANATVIDNLKKMGQPTEIDKKPAVVLPLRFVDGAISLGMLPLGQAPQLF